MVTRRGYLATRSATDSIRYTTNRSWINYSQILPGPNLHIEVTLLNEPSIVQGPL